MADLAVVDTVVLRYFLFVDRGELLLDLLDRPIFVPRIVFDPDEGEPEREEAMSEVTRSLRVQRKTAADLSRPPAVRAMAALEADRLASASDLAARGDVEVVDLTSEEQELFARLTSKAGAAGLGLRFRIDAGEAACVALAASRGWALATDDSDALKALERLSKGHPCERIRRLLQRAAEERLVSRDEANAIHQEMTSLGFRDETPPFEDEGQTGRARPPLSET